MQFEEIEAQKGVVCLQRFELPNENSQNINMYFSFFFFKYKLIHRMVVLCIA